MIQAPNFEGIEGLVHGFGLRDSIWPEGVRLIKQIHSDLVRDAASVGPGDEGDALVSFRAGISIGVKTADCVPILLVDPATGAIASVHAGWRGTAQKILPKVIRVLAARRAVRPENLRVAIGPAIGGCCYEVGPEVAHRFGMEVSGVVHIDLAQLNRRQLIDAGVENIWVSGECTYCSAKRFYSYRREKENAGRMVSFIGRQEKGG